MTDGQEHSGGLSAGGLALVLGALLCLTALTVAAARLNTGELKIWITLGIAAAKSSLVLLYFMDLRRAGTAVAVSFWVTLITLSIFISLIFFDIRFRY